MKKYLRLLILKTKDYITIALIKLHILTYTKLTLHCTYCNKDFTKYMKGNWPVIQMIGTECRYCNIFSMCEVIYSKEEKL